MIDMKKFLLNVGKRIKNKIKKKITDSSTKFKKHLPKQKNNFFQE
jgi:hypothetical protein